MQETSGDWSLTWNSGEKIGIWPKKFFSNLGITANEAEWGGEVFSPPNITAPGMGSGHPLAGDAFRDALCGKAHIRVNNTIVDPPRDLLLFADIPNYQINNAGNIGGTAQYVITFGGFPGPTGD